MHRPLKSAALVAVAIFLVVELLAGTVGRDGDVLDINELASFVAEVDARSMRPSTAPDAPRLDLSAFPLAAHGDHGRVFAGLLALYALGSAAANFGNPERALFLRSVAALARETCAEIVGAGRRLADTARPTSGRLAVVERFRGEAERGECSRETLDGIFRALGAVEATANEDRESEYAAAREGLGKLALAVTVLVEAA
jgi:hypothetical protein